MQFGKYAKKPEAGKKEMHEFIPPSMSTRSGGFQPPTKNSIRLSGTMRSFPGPAHAAGKWSALVCEALPKATRRSLKAISKQKPCVAKRFLYHGQP